MFEVRHFDYRYMKKINQGKRWNGQLVFYSKFNSTKNPMSNFSVLL